MSIYARFGVRTVINATGTVTRLGGALMEKEILDAMWEAGQYSVCLEELQAAASQVISRLTHAEAGIVTAGASAALTLAAAACICCTMWSCVFLPRPPMAVSTCALKCPCACRRFPREYFFAHSDCG